MALGLAVGIFSYCYFDGKKNSGKLEYVLKFVLGDKMGELLGDKEKEMMKENDKEGTKQAAC